MYSGFLIVIIGLLPLTHMSQMLRNIVTYQAFYIGSVLVVVAYFILFFTLAYRRAMRIST